jgi:predicted nuclease of restriction endonuclease-like (RecB) superfamily
MSGKHSLKRLPKTKRIIAQPVRQIVSQAARQLPKGYPVFLKDLKARIRSAQIKASLSVNRELIQLYWSVGRHIVERQQTEHWGAKVIDLLSADIQREFPQLAGFSRPNVYRMRSFYLAYAGGAPIVSQPARQLDDSGPPEPVASLPWFHNVALIEQLKNPAERLWYAQQTIANGWSRAMLVHWIDSDLYSRQGKAITSFKATLPPAQSDLAEQVLKCPYNHGFLTLRAGAAERELEQGLLAHIRNFLLELGGGFAFVGQQVPLEVDGEDYTIDLLFYHLRLRCYIVIDLKANSFKPEFAGKMNFYLSVVDDLLRHPDDKPSVGLILCKTRSKVIAEYALRDVKKPVGVSQYRTKLLESLPANLRSALPTPTQLKAELRKKGVPESNGS